MNLANPPPPSTSKGPTSTEVFDPNLFSPSSSSSLLSAVQLIKCHPYFSSQQITSKRPFPHDFSFFCDPKKCLPTMMIWILLSFLLPACMGSFGVPYPVRFFFLSLALFLNQSCGPPPPHPLANSSCFSSAMFFCFTKTPFLGARSVTFCMLFLPPFPPLSALVHPKDSLLLSYFELAFLTETPQGFRVCSDWPQLSLCFVPLR